MKRKVLILLAIAVVIIAAGWLIPQLFVYNRNTYFSSVES